MSKSPLLGIALVVAVFGCSESKQDTRWEKSRNAYCDEVQLLEAPANKAYADLSKLVQESAAIADPDQRRAACEEVDDAIDQVAANFAAVHRAAHVLAIGRRDGASLESVGLVTYEGVLPLDAWSSAACRGGDVQKATQQFSDVVAAMQPYLAKRLESCKSAGWKRAGK